MRDLLRTLAAAGVVFLGGIAVGVILMWPVLTIFLWIGGW